ncbi:MAG TPA: RNA polymerase sigma factor SigJ [Candidatus Baltobacteraceae bacterium]|nr:RNA polymerase sigma factor SigJ [Candidatus Baltobacteraceae bacterium]
MIDDLAAERARLVRHAYHMLGSHVDAEDVVQDAFVRWQRGERSNVRDAHKYLRAAVTNLSIDRLRERASARETYVGPWLPEPILLDESAVPESAVTLAEDVSFAFLLALERLSPLERAAFLLHDALDIPFAEIATLLERSEESVRQLASRARHAIRESRPKRTAARVDAVAMRERFANALLSGDIAALTALLSDDVRLLSDGGGKKLAAINPLAGPDRVGRFLHGVMRKGGGRIVEIRPAWINGLAGFATFWEDGLDQALAIESDGEKITAIYISRNPDKLASVAKALGDVPIGLSR